MTRPTRADRPPKEFEGDDVIVWNRVVRALKAQRLWAPTDAELVTLFVGACRRARIARALGRPDVEAERDAVALADRLLLTPDARKRHGMTAKPPGGMPLTTEASGSISGVC